MLRALPFASSPAREAVAQSLLGGCLWAVAVAFVQPGWAPDLLLFGPLVLYPLLLDVLEAGTLRRWSLLLFAPVIVSYALEQGIVAGTLVVPWLLFTLIFFGHRLIHDIKANKYVFVLIKGFLIVGACWLVLARLGQRPLNYEHVIVHATAVHFHYAGFVLPILAWQWVQAAPGRRRWIVLGALLLGVPFVAAGITLSAFGVRWLECAAACFFCAACAWFALEQLRFAFGSRSLSCRVLFAISSLSLTVAMCFAFLYGIRHYWTTDWLDIPLMLRTHGPIQVLGFALPGVVACRRASGSLATK